MLSIVLKSLIVISVVSVSNASNQLKKLQRNHIPQRLTTNDIQYLSSLSNVDHLNQAIDKILVPRVVGTRNHENVYKYITSELESFDFNVEVDEFQAQTPKFGRLTFKNIIGTLNPNADRFLVLACHYDSKYFEDIVFVGATDSAVPCAMMLNLVKTLKPHLDSIKSNTDVSLKLIFFDGEEAFDKWGPKDSIYGAKHLAAQYHRTHSLAKSTTERVSELEKIDVLMLLDLIGEKEVNFYNYFPETSRWYQQLVECENRLDNLGLLQAKSTRYFIPQNFFNSRIEDDHLPFLKKNVPILHLIPIPFPKGWHTEEDNRNIIDISTVENINTILRVFVTEYLHALVN
ncbi:hypothetical protein ABEB36_009056 [Hypothenemus hampei]|uniref:Glutaminyl-peptide cyclotransferase n=1 Tax=Hypothenemus hampei TaxID=57062 RepID=A0ABD1ER52_HYPHA